VESRDISLQGPNCLLNVVMGSSRGLAIALRGFASAGLINSLPQLLLLGQDGGSA
jgi:hypothetical protein